MTEIKYGLISKTDARTLEKTIDLIAKENKNGFINILEVGCYSGETGNGMREYVRSKGLECFLTGIDNSRDGEKLRFEYDLFINGNSNEVYNKIPDSSQHLIFQDACHCFACTASTFFCYAPKVKAGAYLAFHDTGEHIKSFKDFQHGDKENPDAYISVRKALAAVGAYEYDKQEPTIDHAYSQWTNWELIFDEADPENEAGGITVFKKLY